MAEPELPYGLIGDQLHQDIKDYVARIPSVENNVGDMFESTALLVEHLAGPKDASAAA